jgi:hypothetical protein
VLGDFLAPARHPVSASSRTPPTRRRAVAALSTSARTGTGRNRGAPRPSTRRAAGTRLCGPWIEPHKQFGAPAHPRQCTLEHVGRIGVPAIGRDDDDRAPQRAAVWRQQQSSHTAAEVSSAVATCRPPFTSWPVWVNSSTVAGGKSKIGLTGPAMSMPRRQHRPQRNRRGPGRSRWRPVTTAMRPTSGRAATGLVMALFYPWGSTGDCALGLFPTRLVRVGVSTTRNCTGGRTRRNAVEAVP